MVKCIISFLFLSVITCGCSDWLTIMPKTQMPAEEMFKTEEGFQDALMGVYIDFSDNYKIDGLHVGDFIEHLACQWDGFTEESDEGKMNRHEYFDVDSDILRMFRGLYKSVTDVNIILEYIENGVLKEETYRDVKGQLLALRSFFHFELIRLWGPMPRAIGEKKYLPYVTKVSVDPYEYLSYDSYMGLLKEDLNAAEDLLLPHTKSDSTIALKSGYLRYNGLIALRGRVALWMGDKEETVKYAQKIYEMSDYSLGTNADVNAGDCLFSKEFIFSLSYDTKLMTFLSNYYVFEEILNEDIFVDALSDIRLIPWKRVEESGEGSDVIKMNCTKYNLPEKTGSSSDNNQVKVPLFRLAEIYLMLVECLEIEEANKVYSKFCEARRCPYVEFTNEAEREMIWMKEYRREFIAEGQLFYFYKRQGVKNMPRCVRACGADSYVLPLPRKEVDINN